MTEPPSDVDEVEQRLREIRTRKRGGLRWNVSKHTAEIAIGALELPRPLGKSGKSRRRKRAKRLL